MKVYRKEKRNMKKLAVLTAVIFLANINFSANELDDVIKNYYNNKDYNLLSMRDTKGEATASPSKIRSSTEKVIKNKANLKITNRELMIIADKIYENETGGKKWDLVSWNSGENFPSLGIGHFIWAKSPGSNGRFGESLPELVNFYRSKGIKVPKVLEQNRYSPWRSRTELLSKRDSGDREIAELIDFFDRTRDTQVLYIFERLEASLGKMLDAAKDKENVRKQFYRVANSPNGLYPLIDYVNFKGEGTKPSEGYKGQGWGLLQVLENMKGTGSGKAALVEFSDSAKFVLQRRVNNSDPAKNEKKWLPGWFKRCDTYKE